VIGDIMSDWVQMVAGMLQESYLEPVTFVILIGALHPICIDTQVHRRHYDDRDFEQIRH